LLLSNDSKVDNVDMHGMSALHYAAREGHADIVRCLMQNNSKVDAKDKNGCTPLILCCRAGRID
jgi:ankyrin repeat protein